MDIMVKDLRYTFQVTSISKAIKRNIQICFLTERHLQIAPNYPEPYHPNNTRSPKKDNKMQLTSYIS